jgi:hypothetical protein
MTAAIPVTTRRFGPSGSWKNANIILEHTTAVIARISKELFLKLTCMRVWPRRPELARARVRRIQAAASSAPALAAPGAGRFFLESSSRSSLLSEHDLSENRYPPRIKSHRRLLKARSVVIVRQRVRPKAGPMTGSSGRSRHRRTARDAPLRPPIASAGVTGCRSPLSRGQASRA